MSQVGLQVRQRSEQVRSSVLLFRLLNIMYHREKVLDDFGEITNTNFNTIDATEVCYLRGQLIIVYTVYRNIKVDRVTWYSMGNAGRGKARS